MEEKKKAIDIVLESLLRDIEEKEQLPWQRPYEMYDSFNWVTKHPYSGINRLMLPFGEYLTRKQINDYNEKMGEDYRFQKGIRWYPVVYFTDVSKKITEKEFRKLFPDIAIEEGILVTSYGATYKCKDGQITKEWTVLKYYNVAERKFFKNSKGEILPSKIETGEVVINHQKPQEVWDSYIKREGIEVRPTNGTPCYIPVGDVIELNPYMKSEASWWSTCFHEGAHSTGHATRLKREFGTKMEQEKYAIEECIAEIAACLMCAECGVNDFETSGVREYDNNVAYVQAWKSRIKSWGKKFVYIASQVDKAFNYMLGIE